MTGSEHIGIDLFAGAGGLSLGLSKAGFDMRLGVEIDHICAGTLGRNHTDMKVIVADVQLLKPSDVLRQAGIAKKDLALIAGGPPCRGFSVSNKRNRRLNNPMNTLYLEFFRFVKDLSPRMFLLENVEGLSTLGGGAILRDILELGSKIGYSVKHGIVEAENFGVPQRRKRILFIGSAKGDAYIPTPETSKTCTVREAIDDLPVLENGNDIEVLEYSRNTNLSYYERTMRQSNGRTVSNNLVTKNGESVLKRYIHIPQGGNWRNVPLNLMSNYKNLDNCHRWIYYRLKWNEPSIVIGNYRKNMLIHPEQHRGLSVREAARLQSFPDDYVFFGKLGSQQQQIANAVPPMMVELIGKNIIKEMED